MATTMAFAAAAAPSPSAVPAAVRSARLSSARSPFSLGGINIMRSGPAPKVAGRGAAPLRVGALFGGRKKESGGRGGGVGSTSAVSFPRDYGDVVIQVQKSLKAALADGNMLLEIEFPTGGLQSVPGDGEGAVEMTQSMTILRDVMRDLARGQDAEAVRVFFPDNRELEKSRPTFEDTPFQLGYLTKPSGLLDVGIDFGKRPVTERVEDSDRLFVVAYPSFNVNEMLTVEELYNTHAKEAGAPIVTFNGELDRIRSSGYYPALFYPKIAKLGKNFLPGFESAYYIHNFKGTRPGVLFRAYPGPWQVLRRRSDGSLEEAASFDEMPTLKDVALNIL